MSDPFIKLYGSILDSSIWLEPAPTRLLWITLLAMADANGVVTASTGGLAARARITRNECLVGLQTLSSPDPDSKSPEFEGRRIEMVVGGWRILNHRAYRDKRTKVQEQTAERVRRHRARPGDGFDPLAVPIPLELQSPAFEEAWRGFVEYRKQLGKPFKTDDGPVAAFRHLIPLGPELAVRALAVTREKQWQGVEYGISELARRDTALQAAVPAAASRADKRRASQELELERRRVVSDAFNDRRLTAEQRDSIVEAAERATCREDLERILWP